MEHQRILFIIRGLPGNGKSTLASYLNVDVSVAADDYSGLYIDGVYQEHLKNKSHDWCYSRVINAMVRDVNTIAVHNVFAKRSFMDAYINTAKLYGYTVHIIESQGVLLANGTNTKSIHNVPDDVIERIANHWER